MCRVPWRAACLLLLASSLTESAASLPSNTFYPICGNYCGKGWCGGKIVEEGEACDFGAKPFVHPLFGESCADACCKQHDLCCGKTANYTSCNGEMEDCLKDCSPLEVQCVVPWAQPLFFPVPLLTLAMEIVKERCCASECTE